MKTSLFDFSLPESLIADRPASPRDSARMLVVDSVLHEACVRDLTTFLRSGDVMVFNDTRVIPARLFGKRGEATVEVLLHKRLEEAVWQCFAKPAKKLRPGDHVHFAEGFHARVEDKLPDGQVVLRFSEGGTKLREKLQQHGHMPLPPYIEKKRSTLRSADLPAMSASQREGQQAEAGDNINYQTIYARHEGSVAAPTAGLHFTDSLLAAIDAMGVMRTHVTLHVGGGTFLPVKAEDTDQHVMHSEWAQVPAETAQIVNTARAHGHRIIAVGTTSLRTLESASTADGMLHPFEADTNIFITPGYRFKSADMLLTNFHLPRSTLFMLACAFSGLERMKAAYAHAIAQHYRFYSYGDACLLHRNNQ